MKYTKEQLQAMSDFEVNKALAVAQGRYAGDWMPNGVKVSDESGFFYSEMDYCKKPNDIMPLAFEYKINLMYCYELSGWMAMTLKYYEVSANPLRAIACCLILALQES